MPVCIAIALLALPALLLGLGTTAAWLLIAACFILPFEAIWMLLAGPPKD